MKLKLVRKEPVAKNMVTFWFQPELEIKRIPGQYTQLYIPHPNPDDRKDKRWFTISSSPTEKLWSITTKFDPVRKSSFKTALAKLEIGDEISGQLPMGDFVLPKDSSKPLVFVAGGIGITPYRSILKYLVDTKENRNVTLIYAASSLDELAFLDILESSGARLIKHIGRLEAAKILEYAEGIYNQTIYISGPEKMVENLQKDLIEASVRSNQIMTDFFHNYD